MGIEKNPFSGNQVFLRASTLQLRISSLHLRLRSSFHESFRTRATMFDAWPQVLVVYDNVGPYSLIKFHFISRCIGFLFLCKCFFPICFSLELYYIFNLTRKRILCQCFIQLFSFLLDFFLIRSKLNMAILGHRTVVNFDSNFDDTTWNCHLTER